MSQVGWVLRDIAIEFDAADVRCDGDYEPPCSGQRRSLVERYYHSLDFTDWNDVRRILNVYENVLAKLEDGVRDPAGRWIDAEAPKKSLANLVRSLERDGFRYENGYVVHRDQVAGLPSVRHAAAALDAPELHRQLVRLSAAAVDDPGLAIGTAKELVETTCKTILHARGITFDESADITELVKLTRKELGLLPAGVPSAAKGSERDPKAAQQLGQRRAGSGGTPESIRDRTRQTREGERPFSAARSAGSRKCRHTRHVSA